MYHWNVSYPSPHKTDGGEAREFVLRKGAVAALAALDHEPLSEANAVCHTEPNERVEIAMLQKVLLRCGKIAFKTNSRTCLIPNAVNRRRL